LFAFLLIPRFNMMALTGTIEPLRVANYLVGRQLYAWKFVSPGGGSVVASNGMALPTEPLPENLPAGATLFVCGSWDSEHYESPEVFAWLRQQDRRGTRLGAMDIGVYILARAGLIAKRRVAVLWYCIRAFSETYPDIRAEERLFVDDGNRITIAGGTAGVDAMLADIGARYGARLAHEVADHILHHPIREENASQRSSVGGQQEIVHPVLRAAIGLMENNVEEPLSIPRIAARIGVSQRRLERLFVTHVGRSAVAYYRILRLQHARVLLTNTSLSIREIALACGYGSLSHFAKSFADQFGKLPRECRNAWPHDDPAPVWPGLSTSLTGMRPARRH
jgi:AraC family carnitine catabolism transcriptional activator